MPKQKFLLERDHYIGGRYLRKGEVVLIDTDVTKPSTNMSPFRPKPVEDSVDLTGDPDAFEEDASGVEVVSGEDDGPAEATATSDPRVDTEDDDLEVTDIPETVVEEPGSTLASVAPAPAPALAGSEDPAQELAARMNAVQKRLEGEADADDPRFTPKGFVKKAVMEQELGEDIPQGDYRSWIQSGS